MMLKRILFAFLLFGIAPVGYTDIIGVSDAELIILAAKQLEELKQQYDTLQNAYNTAKSQLDSVNQLKSMNQGSYGFGTLSNSLSDLKERQWSPNNWNDALNNVAGGNPTRYKELVAAYERNHKTLDESAYKKGASDAQYALYKKNIAVNKAASVESTYAYNDINKHLKAIHDLSTQIEHAANTKAAIDLNSRLLAEIAYIQTQNLKMQALISQQLAQGSSNDIDIDSQIAKFNRLPDE